VEEVEGDLEEEFRHQAKLAGIRRARLDYIRNVFGFVRPFAIRSKNHHPRYQTNMLKHYTVVATRNALRQKTFSIINVAGLALGMTCFLFIFLWVRDEKRVDNFHVNEKRLYNLYQSVTSNGQTTGSYSTPFTLLFRSLDPESADFQSTLTPEDYSAYVPEMEKLNHYATGYELPWGHPETFQYGGKIQKFSGSRAGNEFFTMFSYSVIAGDARSALQDISSMAISRHMAEFFFDSPEEAVGKTLRYENRLDYTIRAVFDDVGPESSLSFDFLLSWEAQAKQLEWSSHTILTTFQLPESADVGEVEAKLNGLLASRSDPNNPEKITLGLRPYGERYLHEVFVNGKPAEGRGVYVRIFTGVAVFILIMACINFMNLSTARSIKRAKEVGVRKVVGSSRLGLIKQFLGESLLVCFVALAFSAMAIQLLLPLFNSLTRKQITSPFSESGYWMLLAMLLLVTALVAGCYPAFYLSSLKPARILKGQQRFTRGAIWLRKALVGFQFALSTALLITTVAVSQQTRFVRNTNLGYDRENLIYLQLEGELNPRYALLKERAEKMPGIVMVDRSSEAPHAMSFIVDEHDGFTETDTGDDAIKWEGKEQTSVGFKPASVGFDFIKLMRMDVVEGRDFSREYATDSADAFMVNEEAVKQMGMTDPVGKWVSAWNKRGHIIGIVKDYHTGTLREPIKPVIIDVKEYEYFGVIIVRYEPGRVKEALASLETVCREINPNYPFAYQFVDQEYDKLYRSEQVAMRLSNVFAVLGVSISCLGLLGLVMLAGEQRTREIGIRKVLGATVVGIVNLLSKEFMILVLISFVVAAPITAWFLNEWLQGFAYKIELSFWIFAVAGIATLAIALFTISTQAVRSAGTSPAKSLRSE
jgi:ABC-type antimicrobial peptide transport system permease subunit